MSCAMFLENVQAFALGALDAGDRALVEKHLAGTTRHEGCIEALAAAMETVETLDAGLPEVSQRSAVWDRISEAVDVPAIRPGAAAPAAQKSDAALWGVSLAAGVALVFLFMRNQALEQTASQQDELRTRITALEQQRAQDVDALERMQTLSSERRRVLTLLQKPSTRVLAFAPQGSARQRATAVVSAEESKAYIVSSALQAVAGKDYQLWVIRGAEAPVAAGLLRIDADGVAVAEFDPRLMVGGVPDALAVSVEPTGGSKAPTEVVLVAKLAS